MPYAIRSYEGSDEWVSKKWLAHMNLGNDIYMSFFGATKAEAEAKARAWYEREENRYRKADARGATAEVKIIGDPVIVDPSKGWDSFNSAPSTHGLAGKVWMVNKTTGHKTRIDPSEVDQYARYGYVRGGPRS